MDRVEDVWDRKWSGLLCVATVLDVGDNRGGARLFEVIKLCRSGSGCQRAQPALVGRRVLRPLRWRLNHELIIIIIQCLWAAVGSPSKREDGWSARGPSWIAPASPAPA